MEGVGAEDFLRELQNYSLRQFDLNPLLDLSSGRKNLMSKYLDLQEEEPWPLLAEYFGVALAFAALGALIRGANGNRVKEVGVDETSWSEKISLQKMLKVAMGRLQCLARNARDLQERMKERAEVGEKDRKEWDEDKDKMLRKLANAETEIKELKSRRTDDAKANEKVVRIYASREHAWKAERKKLCHEISMLRKDLIHEEASGICGSKVGLLNCDECDVKERLVIDLKKLLKEKEVMAVTEMEDSRNKEAQIRELTSKLAAENKITTELNETLQEELSNSKEREIVLNEVRRKQKETERQLMKTLEELGTAKTKLESLSLAIEGHSSMTLKLSDELSTVRQESEDKDVMISTMLERSTLEREEKEDLARELFVAQAGKEATEAELRQWKRLAEDKDRRNLFVEVPDSRSGHRSHRSLGNRSECEKIVDHERSHLEEVKSLCTSYRRHVEALEKQLMAFTSKAQKPASSPIPTLLFADLQESASDPTSQAWFEDVKGRLVMQMEEKHRNQIETFERHLRAKDERLSAFRSKLLTMETELAQSRTEFDDLGCDAAAAVDDFLTAVKSEHDDVPSQVVGKSDGCARCADIVMAPQRSMEKLQVEPEIDYKDKLNVRDDEHNTTIEKILGTSEGELQLKGVQLAALETKHRQLPLQLEQPKSANKMASSDISQENVLSENAEVFPVSKPEKVLQSSQHADATSGTKALELRDQTPEKNRLEMCFEKPILLDNSVSDSAKLLSRLKDLCLKEEKPPTTIRFHKKLELETSDSIIFSTDDSWLTAEQKTGAMTLHFSPEKDDSLPESIPHLVWEDEDATFGNNSLRAECGRDLKTSSVHRKGKKGANKQPLSPIVSDYHSKALQTFDDILYTQAPSKGTRLARFDMSDELEDHASQRVLFTDMDGLQSAANNPTFVTEENQDGLDEIRQKSQTRQDIQVLGLALEVRSIEQQLSEMNKSIEDAQKLINRPVKSIRSLVETSISKQASHCMGLAGKVSQLAKQISLTRPLRRIASKPQIEVNECAQILLPSPDLCLRKNPLFLQETSASELASLQERAEKVGESLSAIQARLAKENRSDFYARHEPAMAPKSKLVDDVQTHLSQVQESLHSKLTQTATARRPLLLTASKPSTPTKALTPRNHTTPIKPSTPLKQFSPTRHILASSPKQTTSIKPVTPSPRRITSTKLLTPSPRSFTPSKPLTPALSPYGRRVGSPMKPKQVYPKTGMVEIVKDDLRSRAAFGRKETKSLVRDSQTRHWARKTSTHYELDLEHLR
ncbi:uncharacterized protein [Physcomitrium patens]|uniref:Uncharacterized protein n=1 Tax=Physcomitrium patens TaxID=3218 RepID=A0A2K1JXZ8_PHYPA|nr:putative leucine-rich repeat-containing protein DDB_G0290503 [Physcomitrium patens]PNR46404.1 hypothetical protein PHYPA_013523 [Physcomitrium patens]|eukprot:XP_024386663.1 putative leucine-rich repeat-containing protein DDB_G0290503 [Physcomitrella patens]